MQRWEPDSHLGSYKTNRASNVGDSYEYREIFPGQKEKARGAMVAEERRMTTLGRIQFVGKVHEGIMNENFCGQQPP